MAVIVSDTTPLNYLILIGAVDVLRDMYGRVLIPPAVREELGRSGTPEIVRTWLRQSSSWLEVVGPSVIPLSVTSQSLDPGEMEAIALALETPADLLLIDEREGTAVARDLGLAVTGTLGVLDQAARLGLVDLPLMFSRLEETTFRAPAKLIAQLLEQHADRKAR